MKKIIRLWALTLFVCPLLSADLSVFAGSFRADSLSTPAGSVDLQNSSSFGIRYEKYFFLILGFENNLAYVTDPIIPSGTEGDGGFYYTSNLVLNLPIPHAVPFLTLGIGFLRQGGDAFPDIGTRFLTTWGTGVKFREVLGPLGFRFDFRRLSVKDVLDEEVNNNEFSGGLIFTF